jgi:hypothetical protein
MVAVNRTITGRGQKLTRQATSTTEDTYTLTNPNVNGVLYVQLVPSTVGIFYHSTSGQSQTDGMPIAAGASVTIPIPSGAPFYISAQTGTGTLDMLVL